MTTPSPAVRDALFALWTNRASLERRSHARFARLARELRNHALPEEIVSSCARAAADEQRHAALCAEMAQRFSTGHPVDRGSLVDEARADDARGDEARAERDDAAAVRPLADVLAEVALAACVGETCNAAYLTESLAAAADPATRAATQELLRDEVRHARFGWACLAAARARDPRVLDFLAARLPQLLAAANLAENRAAIYEPPEPSPALALLPRAQRLALFEATLRGVILPGFDALGVDTRAARGATGCTSTDPRS